MLAILFSLFMILQVSAHVLFKYGSTAPERFVWSFAIGNVVGVASIWFIMLMYQRMNANVVQAMASGGAFLVIQIVLAVAFDGRLSLLQWVGMAMILAGILVAVLCGAGTVAQGR